MEGMVPDPLKKPRELPQIPGYRMEGILGRGATGIVYRARQLSVDRMVALKVLHPELVGSAAAAKRLQREARLTARLAHPSIISAIDMGEIGGQWWYAMELVDGVSLAERIAEKPLSEREALRVFAPILEALQHAFERGVVHRDIKPSNILIERGGRALLVDLGLAYSDEDPELTKHGATLGTPHYMSPEQARDPKSADAQSDLWSLGATLYHAVTGHTPFQGESVAEILSNVLYARIPDPREHAPELSSGFVLVLRKCLARDRAVRYRTPAELAADWERLRERRAPEVTRRGLDPLARRPLRGARRWAVMGALALALGAAAAAGSWYFGSARLPAAPDPRAQTLALLDVVPDGPPTQIAAALAQIERMRAGGEYAPAMLDGITARLLQRLDEELRLLERERETAVMGAVAKRDFARARQLAQESLRPEVARRVGSRALPRTQSDALDLWQAGLLRKVDDSVQEAESLLMESVDRYTSEILLPEIDLREREGDWRGARERLEQGADVLLANSGIELAGLRAEVVARAQTALRKRLDARRVALDAAWVRLDQEWVDWVQAQEAAALRGLEQRSLSGAPARMQALADERGWPRILPPSGLVAKGPEEWARAVRTVQEREDQLAREDAARLLRELDAQAASLWKAREYEAVRALYDALPPSLLEGETRAEIGLRREQAERLLALLSRAAQALSGSSGATRELILGTLSLRGKVETDGDPLLQPFRFVLDGAAPRRLALRERLAGGGAQVLSTASVLQLAALKAGDAQDRLLRALFLYRESGETDSELLQEAARELDRAPMSAEDPLVAELGRLLSKARIRTLDVAERQRREQEGERLLLLRRMVHEGGSTQPALTLARELLAQRELWTEDELGFLRQTRDALEAARLMEEDPVRALGAARSQDLGNSRVRLSFEVAGGKSGALAIGSWLPDGGGWAAPRTARDDAEFLERASPTLPLNGLALAKDELVLRLSLVQPEDTRPEVLMISAAGFHIVFFAQGEDHKPRWLVDSLSAERALARVRGGEGAGFAGWKAGAKVELVLRLSAARGSAEAEINGKALGRADVTVPRAGAAVMSVRTWERVRMTGVAVEAKTGR